jgi:hypothetical protein
MPSFDTRPSIVPLLSSQGNTPFGLVWRDDGGKQFRTRDGMKLRSFDLRTSVFNKYHSASRRRNKILDLDHWIQRILSTRLPDQV